MEKAEAQISRQDSLKIAGAVLIVLASMAGFYYFSEQLLVVRVIGLLAGVGLAVFVFAQSEPGRTLLLFAQDSRIEVRKMVWPTRQETLRTTLVVVAMVIVMALLLWLLDWALLSLVRLITTPGG